MKQAIITIITSMMLVTSLYASPKFRLSFFGLHPTQKVAVVQKATVVTPSKPALSMFQIKAGLRKEVAGLEDDLSQAEAQSASLQQDKISIQGNLNDMKDWGLEQQKEKDDYYNQAVAAQNATAQAKAELVKEKANAAATLVKYHKNKGIMACLAGLLLLMVYIYFGQPIVSLIAKALGPYGLIAEVAAPVAAFGLGYLLVFLLF